MAGYFAVAARRMSKRAYLALVLAGCVTTGSPQSSSPLRLDKKIIMPGVQGRIDHMFFDDKSGRLFVAALGNNTVEIIDTRQGKRVHSISGLREPQGILYLPSSNRLYVANRQDGSVCIFDGSSYELVASVQLGDNADNIRWDDEKYHVYVGYGSGALASLDEKGVKVSELKLDAHPESFRLEAHGSRIFVNLPGSRKVSVLDRKTKSVLANWSTGGASANYPMALDEPNHRLLVVCRLPARLLVFDTQTGRIVGEWPVVGDCDDVFYDAATKRIYASGGDGKISVFQQQDANQYSQIANVPTRSGARTSLFSAESRALYVAARQQGSEAAAVFVYHVQP
jgi:DNA-binding beta-propeller fold protein YncE